MELKHFKLKFKKPILFKNNFYQYKEGLHIVKNNTILGEISPLPEYTEETIEHCKQKTLDFFKNQSDLNFEATHSYKKEISSKIIRFGISMANNNQLDAFRNTNANAVKYQSLLLSNNKLELIDEAIQSEKKGFKLVKIKINRFHTKEEIEAINEVCKRTQLMIRLDANSTFKLSQAIDFANQLPKDRIDFIEDPLKNIKESDIFFAKTKIPFALDENLQLYKDMRFKGIKAIVIKPTLLGDLSDLRDLISSFSKSNSEVRVVLSSSYESPIGLKYLKTLAMQMSPNEFHGFDTEKHIDTIEYL